MNKLASCNQSSISTASNNKNKNNKNNSISRTICVRRTQKVKNNVLNCSTASTASTTTTTMTTEIGSTVWYEFEANVLGEFGSVTREYDYKADDHEWAGLDNPLRYVHGVGVVPISSMPFADEHLETNAKCVSKIKRSEDEKTLSVCVETKRSFAECGEEASFGSCGGSEWNEHSFVGYWVHKFSSRCVRDCDLDTSEQRRYWVELFNASRLRLINKAIYM